MNFFHRSMAVALAAASLFSNPAWAAINTKGEAAVFVACGHPGKVEQRYNQMNAKHWVEHNQNGAVDKRWVVTNKDEWSIYLRKPGVDLQLDLHTRKCIWKSGGGANINMVLNAH